MREAVRSSVHPLLLRAVLWAALLFPLPAGADSAPSSAPAPESESRFLPDPDEVDGRTWHVSVGAVAGLAPKYEGSNGYDFGVSPNIAVKWKDTLFIKGKSGGVKFYRRNRLELGAIVKLTGGRDEDDVGVEGVEEVDGSTEVGGFVEYRPNPYRYELEVRHDVGSGHGGTVAELAFGIKLPREDPWCTVKFLATLASDNYMDAFFGVTREEAARTGLRRYNPDPGLKDVGISFRTGYQFSDHWAVGFQVEYKLLVGDAADSPFVDDLGSPHQIRLGPGLTYTF